MMDSSIVTIIDNDGNCLGDFGLPTKITIKELSKKMMDFLKAKDSETYAGLSVLKFQYKDRILEQNETLYENGIWDGSFLKIIF